jgi:hypothetical protein
VATACTQGKRTQHGKPHGVVSNDQPETREGQAGRLGGAERFAVWVTTFICMASSLLIAFGAERLGLERLLFWLHLFSAFYCFQFWDGCGQAVIPKKAV